MSASPAPIAWAQNGICGLNASSAKLTATARITANTSARGPMPWRAEAAGPAASARHGSPFSVIKPHPESIHTIGALRRGGIVRHGFEASPGETNHARIRGLGATGRAAHGIR